MFKAYLNGGKFSLMSFSAVLPASVRAKFISVAPKTTLKFVRNEKKCFYRFILSYKSDKKTFCYFFYLWRYCGDIGFLQRFKLFSSDVALNTAVNSTDIHLNMNGKKPPNNGENGDSNKPQSFSMFPQDEADNEDFLMERSVLFVFVMILISYVLYRLAQPLGKHTGWTSLLKHADLIESIHLYNNYAQVYLEGAKVYLGLVDDQHTNEKLEQLRSAYVVAKLKKNSDLQQNKSAKGENNNEGTSDTPSELELVMHGTPLAEQALEGLGVFAWVIPFVFFPVFVMILSSSIGKSLAATLEAGKRSQKLKDMVFRVEHTSKTRFHHIAGMKEAKKEITEIVDFLRQPERYTTLGAKIPTGALLLGPPGTGKTLLAKAVAGESGVGFIPVCGSDFVELYVGMGALRVRQLFESAKKQRCIVYIDEIDAIGLKRSGAGHGEKQEQEHTLNELLTQLDGFGTGNRGDVMILASSNVAQEMLDPALIRPGRFDRIIHVDPPVISERIDIFKVHLSGLKLVDNTKEEARKNCGTTSTTATNHTTGETIVVNAKTEAKQESAAKMTKETITGTTVGGAESVLESGTHHQTANNAVGSDMPKKDAAIAADVDPTKSTQTQLAVIKLKEELEDEEMKPCKVAEDSGDKSFDFHTLFESKSEHERALINIYAQRMSSLCPGFVGSDIANVCNESAILAAREGCTIVDIKHLERSIDRVLAGIEHRSRVLTPFERNVVAHHEAGHAVAGWFLNRADPLMKVSIVPRGGSALGYAQYLPNENALRTAGEIRDSISVTLGGRVAEKIFFNHLSTGASDDLRKVTQMAYQYVTSFARRPVYPAPGTPATRFVKPFGPSVANELDVEAKRLVDEVYESTYALLLSRKTEMETLARHLLENEVLTYDNVVGYLGRRDLRVSDRKKGV